MVSIAVAASVTSSASAKRPPFQEIQFGVCTPESQLEEEDNSSCRVEEAAR